MLVYIIYINNIYQNAGFYRKLITDSRLYHLTMLTSTRTVIYIEKKI